LFNKEAMKAFKGKHVIMNIDGVPCTVVEPGVSPERAAFLKELLTLNGYEVKTMLESDANGQPLNTCLVGVTDLIVNPVIVLYQRKLFRNDGEVVTPAYWFQYPDQWDIPYWQVKI